MRVVVRQGFYCTDTTVTVTVTLCVLSVSHLEPQLGPMAMPNIKQVPRNSCCVNEVTIWPDTVK